MSTAKTTAKTNQAKQRNLWRGESSAIETILALISWGFRKSLWGLLTIGALGLFAWLVWLLLLAPKLTNVVVLSAAPYQWPLPPNAYTAEELANFDTLHGETVDLSGLNDAIFSADDFLQVLQRQIELLDQARNPPAMIVWISMHGVAQPGQEAFLVPPAASPIDSKTWLPVNSVIETLQSVPSSRKVMVVLDCNRMDRNWNIGLLENQFSKQVSQLVNDMQAASQWPDNVSVVLSADTGQTNHVSHTLNGTSFGHYMQLGLAGAADLFENGGDGNGWVSRGELQKFLGSQLNRWSLQSRGVEQNSVWLGSERDFRVVRCLNDETLRKHLIDRQVSKLYSPSIDSDSLDQLWSQLERLRQRRLYQQDPVAFRSLEHQLIWLEQLTGAGTAYRRLAKQVVDATTQQFDLIEGRYDALLSQPGLVSQSQVLGQEPIELPDTLHVHSLPLAQYLGSQSYRSANELVDQVDSLATSSDAGTLANAVGQFTQRASDQYTVGHWLRMWKRYNSPALIADGGPMARLSQATLQSQRLSVPKSTDVGPAPFRLHRWANAGLDLTDPKRRQTQDAIWKWQAIDVDRVRQYEAELNTVSETLDSLVESLAQCDAGLAGLPYHAQWETDPRRYLSPTEQVSIEADVLKGSLQQVLAVSDQLNGPSLKQVESLQQFEATVDSIADHVANQVQPGVEKRQRDLETQAMRFLRLSQGNDNRVIGELQALLDHPLLRWNLRRDVREALPSLQARIEASETIDQEDGDATPQRPDRSQWLQVEQALLVEILGVANEPAESQQATNPLLTHIQQVNEQLAMMAQADRLERRQELGDAMIKRVRTAAAITTSGYQRDPVRTQLMGELQASLIWNADRAKDDFWGAAGQSEPFYLLASRDYLNAATLLDSFSGPSVQGIEQRKQALQELPSRQDQLVQTAVDSVVQLDPKDPIASQMKMTASGTWLESDGASEQSSGDATMMLFDGRSRLPFVSVLPSEQVSAASKDVSADLLLASDLPSLAGPVSTLWMYRGHESQLIIDPQVLGGRTIVSNYDRRTYSDVSVAGPHDKLSVVFVLDCSQSMKEMIVGMMSEEAPNGDAPAGGPPAGGEAQAPPTKMEIAKSALEELLFTLALRQKTRVGVLAFGHRIGWSVRDPGQRMIRPGFSGVLDPAIVPSQDVDQILRLNDYNLELAKSILPTVSNVEPWGQSPLYLSVAEALKQFSAADKRSDCHVIVITDGANYQYIPDGSTGVQQTTAVDAMNVWKQAQVPVHILGLEMNRAATGDAQLRELIAEFDQFSQATGGRFQALQKSTDLNQALRQLLLPGEYQISSATNAAVPDLTGVLGNMLRVSPIDVPRSPFDVRYLGKSYVDQSQPSNLLRLADERIELDGGEMLQLYLNASGDEVFAFPYDQNVAGQDWLVDLDGNRTTVLTRIHQAQRDAAGDVLVPISWQQADAVERTERDAKAQQFRFTFRPKRVWIEVQPLDNNERPVGQPYTYVDSAFVAQQPVPLLHLHAPAWPEQGSAAEVKVWSMAEPFGDVFSLLPPNSAPQDEPLPPPVDPESAPESWRYSVDEQLAKPVTVSEGIQLWQDKTANEPLETEDGKLLHRQRFVLKVFGRDEVNVNEFKVDVDSDESVQPVRVDRRYDQQKGLATHTFYFDSPTGKVASSVELTNKAYQIKGTRRLSGTGIRVPVPSVGGLLPASN